MSNEAEKHERLEELAGGPDRAFRLMRLHTAAVQTCAMDRNALFPPARTVDSVFRQKAAAEGYSPEAVAAFLDL